MAPPRSRQRLRPITPLEAARRESGWTQTALAERVGITRQDVGLIEGGLRPPLPGWWAGSGGLAAASHGYADSMRVAIAVVIAALQAACGSDETPSEREAYIATADALCEESNQRRAPLVQRSEAAAARQDFEAAFRFTAAPLRNLRTLTERLEDLPRPNGDAGELGDFYALFSQGIDTGEQAVAYFRRTGDLEGAVRRANAATQLGETARRLGEEYGFEVCGQPVE